MDIWEDVLKKNVKSNLLPKAKTVPQKDRPYDVQIFEVLVAESLNLQDRHTNWEVTKASHDSGVDLLGTDITPCRTPFAATQYRLLSVGQVKRSKRSYKYEDFRTDIRKARGYWLNSDLFNGNSPKQFLFILSTDGKNGIKILQKHLEDDLAHNNDVQLKSDQLTHVQLIDAAHIIRSWKFHLSFFEEILENALTPMQLACFHEYVSELDSSWLSLSVRVPRSGGVGEPIIFSLLMESPADTVSLAVYARWVPPEKEQIQLLHPLRMVDPRVPGAFVRIKGQTELQMTFRSVRTGLCSFGHIELYSEERMLIASVPLKQLEIYEGICPVYFSPPNHAILQNIKSYIYDPSPALIPIGISGSGGIGKSSLISEAMVTAAEKGYFSIDLMQPKDLTHPRLLLSRIFLQLIRPNIPQDCFLPDILLQVKTYLGRNFQPEWEQDLKAFFQMADEEIDAQLIGQCLACLLFTAADESPVFLWTSNMHWASKETLDIFHFALDILEENQNMLSNRILWILEGRSGEVMSYDQQAYYPVHWERFLTNHLLHPYELPPWSREDGRQFLKQLFAVPEAPSSLFYTYLEKLLDCADGFPMQMLELIRIHLEQGILRTDPVSHRLHIQRLWSGSLGWTGSISDIIDCRIHFYRQKCSDLIDFCVILAAMDDSIPSLLADRLMKRLHTDHIGIDALLFRSGFLTQTGQNYHFCHEYYQDAFRMQQLKNSSLLLDCLTYYERLPNKGTQDRYAEIKLRLMDERTDLAEVKRAILSLLAAAPPKAMEQSLYKLLLQLPLLDSGDLPQGQVLFLLCESYLREGSWQAGADCLEQLLALPRGEDIEAQLLHIKACQELSNIRGDQLLLEQAIQKAEDGLELAELCLELYTENIHPDQYRALCVQREKILARLAVCYWFAGDPARGITVQRKCYDLTVARGDSYSAGHVLYEIGTLLYHFDLDAGLAVMENVLRQCTAIPALEQYERTLIETQYLMGRLLRDAASRDTAELQKLMWDCRRLLEHQRISPHSYEYFLCLTIRGVCAFLLGNRKKAQDDFWASLRCAEESDMPNLRWKALFHLAQICALSGDADPEIYAKEAKHQIEEALESNLSLQKELRRLFQPTLEQLKRLIQHQPPACTQEDTKTTISVSAEGCLFVIMN